MKNKKLQNRLNRKRRIRKNISGTSEKPRLTIFRSLNHTYAQIIDDIKGTTLATCSSLEKDLNKKLKGTGSCDAAKIIGENIGEKAVKQGVTKVVFDRNGYLYHGRVKAFAEGAREKGLKF